MPFEEQLPQWDAPGIEPPASKRATGWQAGEKPPADYWNWQMHRTYKALEELQQKAGERVDVEQAQQTAEAAATAAANAQDAADAAASAAANAQNAINNHISDASGAHAASAISATGGTNVQEEIDNLKSSVSDGKNAIAAAITDMGQAATGSDTFAQLAAKIRDISDDANATVSQVLTGRTFYQGGVKRTGTMPNRTGHVTGQSISRSGTTLRIRPQVGYYPGDSANSVAFDDPNWIAANIREGVSIFGLAGALVAGKKWASGNTTTDELGNLIITGLDFTPTLLVVYQRASSANGRTMVLIASKAEDMYKDGVARNCISARDSNTFGLVISGYVATWGANNVSTPTGLANLPIRYFVFE